MTQDMFGPLVLLAALAAPIPPAIAPAARRMADSSGRTRATAQATATIRIVSGVRFGPDKLAGAEGAARRKAVVTDADGLVRPAELLEFQ